MILFSADDDSPDRSRALQAASDFLLGRINYERTAKIPYGNRHMKLDRMRDLLNRLDNPDAGMPIVHVAGTKGKGSTSVMIAGILRAAGYSTGLFTSPHLESIAERFAVDGSPCPAEQMAALVEQLRPVVEEMDREAEAIGELGPTYFELTTAIALMFFASRKVDIAVLEVGMGGRLDSTNVCQPALTLITSISLDHTKQLGSTVEQIAAEKAGIIKPGVPLLCGVLADGPRQVIADIARRHGCRMIEAGKDFHFRFHAPRGSVAAAGSEEFDFSADFGGEPHEIAGLRLKMLGRHQAQNAALAIATCLRLRKQGWQISDEAIRGGLAEVSLPGRIECVSRQPAVVLDVAHNVASVAALAQVLTESFATQKRTLIIAATKEKDIQGMARILVPHFDRIVVTKYQENPRAISPERLAKTLREAARAQNLLQLPIEICSTPTAAWEAAWNTVQPNELICVTGSFFIVAELRSRILADVERVSAGARHSGER